MRFWDASAIVPLLIDEPQSSRLNSFASSDRGMSVWWACKIECVSAAMRLEREGKLDDQAIATAFERLERLVNHWNEVEPSEAVRDLAVRLLRVHPLRAH